MNISERRSARTVVLSLDGELTTHGRPVMVLAQTVRHLLQQGVESIVLDLQNVSYVDSFGLGELAEANAVAHNCGGTLRLCHVPKRLADLLALTKLDSVFECVIDE